MDQGIGLFTCFMHEGPFLIRADVVATILVTEDGQPISRRDREESGNPLTPEEEEKATCLFMCPDCLEERERETGVLASKDIKIPRDGYERISRSVHGLVKEEAAIRVGLLAQAGIHAFAVGPSEDPQSLDECGWTVYECEPAEQLSEWN
jgi:hypothetical protein